MKHLPKSTPTEILNDPYGFTYKEMSEVIGEDKARALYTELYKQPFHKENLSISTKKVYKSSDTEKYVYELKDNRYIETVFIKRRDGGTVCVSTQVGCSVGCIFCESGRNGFVRNLTPSEIVQQVVLIRQKVNRIVFMGMGEPLFNYDNLIAAIHKSCLLFKLIGKQNTVQDTNILHGVKNIMTNQTGSHVRLQKSSRLGILYPFSSHFASGIGLFVTLMTPCSASACTVFLFSYFIERNWYT